MAGNIFGELEGASSEPLDLSTVDCGDTKPPPMLNFIPPELGALGCLILDIEDRVETLDSKLDKLLEVLLEAFTTGKVTVNTSTAAPVIKPAPAKKKKGTPGRPVKKQPKINVAQIKAKSKAKKAAARVVNKPKATRRAKRS